MAGTGCVLLYAASYVVSLRVSTQTNYNAIAGTKTARNSPMYATRFYLPNSWQEPIRLLFVPAHQIDRRVRPTFWAAKNSPLKPEDLQEMPSATPDAVVIELPRR